MITYKKLDEALEKRVAALLFAHDPARLTWASVPEDEYLGEAKLILDEIWLHDELPPATVIADIVYKTFRETFGTGTLGDSEKRIDFGDKSARELIGTADDYVALGKELRELITC